MRSNLRYNSLKSLRFAESDTKNGDSLKCVNFMDFQEVFLHFNVLNKNQVKNTALKIYTCYELT